MTALRKPTGGVRGIVVGDTFRRAVSRAVGPRKLPHLRSLPPLHSRMLCPLVRAQSASGMPNKPSLTSIQTAPSCQSTGLGRLIWCQERRCSQVCATMGGRGHTPSFLWPNSMGVLHSTSGRMMRGFATPFRGRGRTRRPPDAGQGFHCMLARRRSGTKVADAHPVVKTSLRQQESQTPTQWCLKGDQTLPTDQQGVVVLGAPLGHAHFITRKCRPRQRSTQFCSAGSPVRVASAVVLCCHAGNYFLWVVSLLLTMRTCGIVPRSCWISKGEAVVEVSL